MLPIPDHKEATVMRIRYSAIAPVVGDMDNETGKYTGYRFEIAENDGGVMIQMLDVEEIDYGESNPSSDASYKGIFVGYQEAEEIIEGLRAVIELAKEKGSDLHSGRVRDKDIG